MILTHKKSKSPRITVIPTGNLIKRKLKDLGIALSCAFSVLFSWTN